MINGTLALQVATVLIVVAMIVLLYRTAVQARRRASDEYELADTTKDPSRRNDTTVPSTNSLDRSPAPTTATSPRDSSSNDDGDGDGARDKPPRARRVALTRRRVETKNDVLARVYTRRFSKAIRQRRDIHGVVRRDRVHRRLSRISKGLETARVGRNGIRRWLQDGRREGRSRDEKRRGRERQRRRSGRSSSRPVERRSDERAASH